jgi:hypothetical protein
MSKSKSAPEEWPGACPLCHRCEDPPVIVRSDGGATHVHRTPWGVRCSTSLHPEGGESEWFVHTPEDARGCPDYQPAEWEGGSR